MNQLQPQQMQALWFQQVISVVVTLLILALMTADVIKALREALGREEEWR